MSQTATVTLLGRANESETMTNADARAAMSKAQLNVPADASGLRVRGGAVLCDNKALLREEPPQVFADENNNEVKEGEAVPSAASVPQEQQPQQDRKSCRMWGFFRVDQPVKTLNSIMIPLFHLAALYGIANITIETKFSTIAWGESRGAFRQESAMNWRIANVSPLQSSFCAGRFFPGPRRRRWPIHFPVFTR